MYPGMKPGAGSVQAGTPTALLRSLGAPTTNLFQPIRNNSITGSNQSLSAANTSSSTLQVTTPLALNIPEERTVGYGGVGVVYADVGCQTDALTPGSDARGPEIESSSHSVGDGRITDTAPQGSSDATSSLGLSQEVEQPNPSSNTVLAHQRSRSNEIDYSSVTGRPIIASFQSPPGSYGNVKAFRPVSAGSTNTSSALFSDSLPSATAESQASSSGGTSDSSRTLIPCLDASVGRSCPVSRVSSEGRPASSSYWSREFAAMSDYFASDSNSEVANC